MALNLYSSSLPDNEQEISNTALLESLTLLGEFTANEVRILKWDDNRVAVPIMLSISTPPFQDSESIDIKSKEPVLIVFHLKSYPTIAPRVYPDRLDFPINRIGHLYVAYNGYPPSFCLVRGNINEWYSNKMITHLIIQVRNWLRDASLGRLETNGDQFEPTRLEGYSGIIIYDYNELFREIGKDRQTSNSLIDKSNITFFVFSGRNGNFILRRIINKPDYLSLGINENIGFLLWSELDSNTSEYDVNLPNDWKSFKIYCKKFKISTDYLEYYLCNIRPTESVEIPVILAINRPKKIIGFDGDVEFIHFIFFIDKSSFSLNHFEKDFPIIFMKHNQSLSISKAKEISGFIPNLNERSLIVGCGAVGSKVIMHLVKSGTTNFRLSDPDYFSSHNAVRHALTRPYSINKATYLFHEIKLLFPEIENKIEATNNSGELLLQDKYSYIFDFTSSLSFFNALTNANLNPGTKVCSAFLVESGTLGVIMFEGVHRNPRIDDLQVAFYSYYKTNSLISSWLKNEMRNANGQTRLIEVGVGCNSETTILSDDIISLHSAFFSGIIKQHTQRETTKEGEIYLNQVQYEPYFQNKQQLIKVPEFDIFEAKNNPVWKIRIAAGLIDMIKDNVLDYTPNETGGIFVGLANHKTKTIHVIDLISASSDSVHKPFEFHRGFKGVKQKIDEIQIASGGRLGFIGEWHSHPIGNIELSTMDLATVADLKSEFSKLDSPLPVFIAIVTTNDFIPFVY